jgi:tetratricopeptide (TPR) repeat protein
MKTTQMTRTTTPRHFSILHASLSACLVCVFLAACGTSRTASPYASRADLPRDTRRADTLNARGADLMESDPAAAQSLLREALAADLFHGPAHNNLGVLLLQEDKLYEAAAEFEWARTLMPGHPDPRINLALTLETAGRTDEALAAYRGALEVRPGHIQATQALARLEVTTNNRRPETTHRLRTISLEGDTPDWRRWAQEELSRVRDPRPEE